MSIQATRLAIVALVLAGLFGLVGVGLFVEVKPFEVELIDYLLGVLSGVLVTAAGFYFKG